ncbi:class I SAM-dependent methyltransferase [Pseudonocardia sp. CA-107938]|uniref:class I SAM-dependent methyltransferase n=1 Tax=Pseudonocardia sp. CA-107938 TaxID=3240021 RepID=UPI003D8CD6C1
MCAATEIDPSNVESAAAWDGPSGDAWVTHAEAHDRAVSRYLDAFLAAAALQPDHRVLDVGCGNGLTSIEAARRAGSVVGCDLSTGMLDVARRRAAAAGVANVEFVRADVQVADLGSFDRVISRNGTMFFGDPPAAFTNLARMLRPDGRLVMQVWQPYAEQEWLQMFRGVAGPVPPLPTEGPTPVSLSDPAKIERLLTAAGFAPPRIDGHVEPMLFGTPAEAEEMALSIVGAMLTDLDADRRAEAVAALRASLAAHDGPDGVTYRSAAWIVTAGRW